jgi:hypothetical protein
MRLIPVCQCRVHLPCVCVPNVSLEVDRAHDAGMAVERTAALQVARKRGIDGKMVSVEVTQDARHRAWLRRGRYGVVQAAWRPKKQHRVNAKKWLANTDNQLRVCTASRGWHFFVPCELPCWKRWTDWPHASIGIDLGSDGLCAVQSMMYLFKANVILYPDMSHLYHRAQIGAMQDAGIFRMWLLLMVSWNLVHGKDLDDSRFIQLRHAMQEHYETHTHETSVLFQHFLPGLATELEMQGYEWSSRAAMPMEVWAALKAREALKGSGSRMSLCRFQSMISKPETKVKEWFIDLLERTYLAIESDMLQGGKFMQQFQVKVGDAEQPGEDGGTTNPLQTTFEDRAFKHACQNSIVVSVMTLSDLTNLKIVRAVLSTGSIVKDAHGQQNAENRSSQECKAWFLKQANGEFVDTCSRTVAAFSSVEVHRNIDFIMPSPTSPYRGPPEECVGEDALAAVFGKFTFALAGHVMRRGLFVYSWPWRMVKVLDAHQAVATMAEFRADLAIWRSFSERPEMTTGELKVRRRHLFNLTSNRQYIEADKDLQGTVTAELIRLVDGRHSGCFVTQAVEEMIGVQKNFRQFKGKRKLRTPARSFANVLSSALLEERHHFKPVSADIAFARQQVFMDKDSFQAEQGNWSLKFGTVQSTAPTASWYSPGATTWIAPCSDLHMLRSIHAQGLGWDSVEHAWMGSLFKLSFLVAFHYTAEENKRGWYLGLEHIEGSCVVCWPVTRCTVPGHDDQIYFQPKHDLKEPCLVFIQAILELEACKLVFRSPLWQWQNLPGARGVLSHHTRLFVEVSARPVPKLFAVCAFFDLNRATLEQLAALLGYEVLAGASLFDVLFGLVVFVLGCDENVAIQIVHKRLANIASDTDVTSALLEIDEAANLLEQNDVTVLRDEQKHVRLEAESRKDFASLFKEKRLSLAKAKPKAKGKAKAKSVAPKLDSKIEQPEARKLIPPGSSIWRGLTKGQWCGHLPPYVRVSRPWALNETASCMWVIRELWLQYLEANGLDQDSCTVEGLFTMPL